MSLLLSQHDIHRQLKQNTDDVHQQLHHHPLLSQLTEKHLKADTYCRILQAYHGFYSGVECKRDSLNVWQEFTLTAHVLSLEKDLKDMTAADTKTDMPDFDWMQCQTSALGALYVLHGTSFGAKFIARELNANLPALPHHYFSLGINKQKWHSLINSFADVVEDAESFAILNDSARRTFIQLDNWVS